MKKIFTLFLLLCSFTLFSQSIYFVKPTGNDDSNGLSWATAFKTLQKALGTIISGQIWVAAGTYYPDEGPGLTNNDRNLSFILRNNLAVYGGFTGTETTAGERDWKKNVTILSGDLQQNDAPGFVNNGDNALHVLHAYGLNNSAVLDGFTITAGNANGIGSNYNDGGGGMLNHFQNSISGAAQSLPSAPSIIHCCFTGNSAKKGGAIYNWNGAPAITDCIFSGNRVTADYLNPSGGAIYYGSVEIYGNNRDASITNSIFIGNKANNSQSSGGAISLEENYLNLTITNCSFTGNTAAYNGVLDNNVYAYTKVTNCILWGNSSAIGNYTLYPAQVSYSIVQGSYAGNGNLNVDPQFVNTAAGNLHVMTCSPAIDAGNNEANSTTTDLDGKPRKNGVIDMGAYEFEPGGDTSVFYVKADATGSGNGSSWANAFTSLQDALAHAGRCGINEFWVAKGIYYPDEGLGMTNNSRESSFNLKSGVALYGGFEGTETERIQRNWDINVTILSGDIDQVEDNSGNAYHVVRATGGVDSTTILDGFTITGGHADGYFSTEYDNGGGLYIYGSSPQIANCSFVQNSGNYGGGVYNDNMSTPSLTNCSFTQNVAVSNGGAMCNDNSSSPRVDKCQFSGNKANQGGGIYNNHTSSPLVTNCVFKQNKAGGDGGAFYNYNSSSPAIVNCIFWKDSANRGGGLYNNNSSSPTIINSSFWGNTAASGGVLANMSANATLANCILWGNSSNFYEIASFSTVTYSLVQGGYTGNGNLNQDPLFVNAENGLLLLSRLSPARDAGNDAAVPPGITTDLQGFPRFNGRVDMGAYEYASSGTPGPNEPLTLTCPDNYTVYTDADSCGAIAGFTNEHAAITTGGKMPVTIIYEPASGSFLQTGVNNISVTATDGVSNIKTCSFIVTVVDTTAPVVTNVKATPSMLFPPNHKMKEVKLDYDLADNCPGATTLLSVTSNEPQYGSGSGDVGPDWQVVNDHKLLLRAERSGNGHDRVYTINIRATDASGNTSTTSTTVTVPHDNRSPVTMNKALTTREINALMVSVIPNPSAEGFTIYTESSSNLPLSIKVLDDAGRMIESWNGVVANGMLKIGNNYRPGVYYVQVVQGDVVKTMKLVKQGR